MTKTKILHLGFIIFWILMIGPTLTIWQNSILLVLLMSLYANIEASATAFLSADSKKKKTRPKIKGSVNISHRGVSIKKCASINSRKSVTSCVV